jgi:hypothetical protein
VRDEAYICLIVRAVNLLVGRSHTPTQRNTPSQRVRTAKENFAALEQSDVCGRSARGRAICVGGMGENGGSQSDFRERKRGSSRKRTKAKRNQGAPWRNSEQSEAKAWQSEASSARARANHAASRATSAPSRASASVRRAPPRAAQAAGKSARAVSWSTPRMMEIHERRLASCCAPRHCRHSTPPSSRDGGVE